MFIKLQEALNKNNVSGVKLELDKFIYSFYQYAIDKPEITKEFITNLSIALKGLEFLYMNGEVSPLSDSEYDELHSLYNELTNDVITDEVFSGNKVKHIYPELKGTIEKVHYIRENEKSSSSIKTHRSVEKYLRSSLQKLKNLDTVTIGCFPKYDGVSIVFAFDNGKMISAITRGDKNTGTGRDVTSNFNKIDFSEFIKTDKPLGMKTEVCMTKKAFSDFSNKYKSENRKINDPRSTVSGLINAELLPEEFLKYLIIIPLEFIEDGNIYFPNKTCVIKTLKTNDFELLLSEIEKSIIQCTEFINESPINCDGIVIRFLDKESQLILGRDENNSVNKFEVAYKFSPFTKETKLLGIEFQVGLLGNITPVAKIEPVKLNNKVIKSISLGSINRMESLHLRIGDDVLVKYEIIPYLTKIRETENNNPIIERPVHCPECKSILVENPVLMCVNESCPARMIGKINNYCEKMNIPGFGPAVIEDLFNNKILMSIQDLYSLEKYKDKIISLSGYGKTKYKNLIKSVNSVKEVPGSILLGSIGIKSIGINKMKSILFIYYIDELMQMTENDIDKLTKIDGIGKSTAEKIISGIQSNKSLIEFLKDRIIILPEKKEGDNIVFSGVRNREMANHLMSMGFSISDVVNKNTRAVIVPDLNTKTTKTKKAELLGVPVFDMISAMKVLKF